MRKVELSVSMEALVSTGPFENQRVYHSIKEIVEGDFTDAQLIERQREMFRKFCTDPIELQERELSVKAIQKEFKHLRLFSCPHCGKKHPSITTVRDFDSKGFYCTDEELEIATALGSIQDIKCRHFVNTGEWKAAKELEQCWPHLLVLNSSVKGKTSDPNSFDLPEFLKKYPIKDMKNGERFFNCDWEITSEPDLIAIPDNWNMGSKKEPVYLPSIPSVFDYKRNVDKVSAFTQMSVIAKHHGLKQMIAIPVNGKTEQGYSKPNVSSDVEGYFEIAMDKRRKFRKRYGI